MYMDKPDGRVSQDKQQALLQKILTIQTAALTAINQAVDMLRLTSRASELFLRHPAAEQRRLLGVVVETAAWQAGELRTSLRTVRNAAPLEPEN
jgi:hypothetical protein